MNQREIFVMVRRVLKPHNRTAVFQRYFSIASYTVIHNLIAIIIHNMYNNKNASI